MKFVADESVDRQIVDRLRADGHVIVSIAEIEPGVDDETVLSRSRLERAVLITADKDFGELVFRQHRLHEGILLVRLAGVDPHEKGELVASVIHRHGDELSSAFAVLSHRAFRIRRRP